MTASDVTLSVGSTRIRKKNFLFANMNFKAVQLHIQSQIQLGLPRRDIVKNLVKIGVNESAVYRTIKRINETGTVDGREHNGRKVSVTVPAMVKRVRARINRNPQRSQNRMAKELGIS